MNNFENKQVAESLAASAYNGISQPLSVRRCRCAGREMGRKGETAGEGIGLEGGEMRMLKEHTG